MTEQQEQAPEPPAGYAPASWPRRISALVVDWLACIFVVNVVLAATSQKGGSSFYPLGVFWLESGLGVALVGGSFGQVLTRLRVLRPDGRHLDVVAALLRQALVCIVIPPLVFKPDGRGLHDLVTGSAAYELRRYRG